jgi:Flp pilus assembly protein TadG
MKLAKRFQRGGRRFLRSAEGMSAVEMAVILPVLLLMVCGIMDFGNMYCQVNIANEAAREGARLAAVNPGKTQAQIQTFIQAGYGTPNGITLTVNMSPATSVADSPVTVTVNNPITFYTPIISNLLGSKTVQGRCYMQVERAT